MSQSWAYTQNNSISATNLDVHEHLNDASGTYVR